jgi:hypothetical protein
MKRLLALLLAFFFALLPIGAHADIQTVSAAFSVTATGPTSPLALSGQSVCTVTYTSIGGGSTATVQGAADLVPTYATVTTIGTSGVITNPTVNTLFGGAITPQGLTQVRLNFTSVTSGTIAGTITCSPGAPSSLSTTPSGTQNAAITAPLAASGAVQTTVCDKTTASQCGAVSAGGVVSVTTPAPLPTSASGAAQTTTCDKTTASQCAAVSAGGVLSVSTPAPAPTSASGAQQVTVCDKTTAAQCGAVDANGVASTKVCDKTTSTNCLLVDANGVTAAKVCDKTTTTQCLAVDTNGVVSTRICDKTTTTNCANVTAGSGLATGCFSVGTYGSITALNGNAINGGVFGCDVGAFGLGWNGATWDLLRTVSSSGSGLGVLATGMNSAGATAPVACDKSTAVNITTATTTSVVAVSGSLAVYICGFDLYVPSGTLPSFAFTYGTGAACTGATALTGTYGGIAGTVGENFPMGNGVGTIFRTPASQGVCIVSGGTTPSIQGVVFWAQF